MARLFVAVWPSENVVEELRVLPRKDRRGVRFIDPERWHVTLRFLGDSDPDEVSACLDGLAFGMVRARVGPGVDVLGDRALVVPVAGVDELASEVTRRTDDVGERPRRHFHGHLTLARVKRGAALPPAMGMYVAAEFDVDSIALVESRLHADGARYTTLETWQATASS
jgi:RNA 2',3'-cyclic 3'-phosphodiesterase